MYILENKKILPKMPRPSDDFMSAKTLTWIDHALNTQCLVVE